MNMKPLLKTDTDIYYSIQGEVIHFNKNSTEFTHWLKSKKKVKLQILRDKGLIE